MITPELLTKEAFAPFGEVLEATPDTAIEINSGFTTRFHQLAAVDADRAAISVFSGRRRPMEISMLECHPYGSQAFYPLGGGPWLAVVAAKPKPEACRAFMCGANQGLQYSRGTWHHPLLILEDTQDFLVIERLDPESNLEEVFFDEPVQMSV